MCLVQPNTSKLRELLRAHSLEGQRRRVREQAVALCAGEGVGEGAGAHLALGYVTGDA